MRVDGVKAPQHRGTPRSHGVVEERARAGEGARLALEDTHINSKRVRRVQVLAAVGPLALEAAAVS